MSRKPFPNIAPGEEVELDSESDEYFLACCDCHLVHKMRFRVDGKMIYMSGWRDNRKTAALRRHRGIPIVKERKNG